MPELHLITGNDEPSIAARAKKLVTQLAGDDADEFTLDVLKEGAETSAEQLLDSLLESLRTPSFFGGQKTVCLMNFSAFAEEPPKSKKDRELRPVARKLRQLAEFIENQFPEDVALVLSGPAIDKRKGLFKLCSDLGKVIELKKPDLKDRRWREHVSSLIQSLAGETGLQLDRKTVEYLIEVIGVDTGRIRMEMEKIYCYAGGNPTLAQVRDVCAGNREAYFYAFTVALGERQLNATLEALAQTMDNAQAPDGECIRLVRQTATYFRRLLHAKIAMAIFKAKDGYALTKAVESVSSRQAERLKGNLIRDLSNWQLRSLGDQAKNYSGHELRAAIRLLSVVDRKMVSSSLPNRLVLEMMIVQIVSREA